MWLELATLLGPALANIAQGAPDPTMTRFAIRQQPALLQQLIKAYTQGQGEFGFGPAAKQGRGTLMNFLNQRNINPASGVGGSLYASMLAQAMAQDAQARRMYGLQLGTAAAPTVSGQSFAGPLVY